MTSNSTEASGRTVIRDNAPFDAISIEAQTALYIIFTVFTILVALLFAFVKYYGVRQTINIVKKNRSRDIEAQRNKQKELIAKVHTKVKQADRPKILRRSFRKKKKTQSSTSLTSPTDSQIFTLSYPEAELDSASYYEEPILTVENGPGNDASQAVEEQQSSSKKPGLKFARKNKVEPPSPGSIGPENDSAENDLQFSFKPGPSTGIDSPRIIAEAPIPGAMYSGRDTSEDDSVFNVPAPLTADKQSLEAGTPSPGPVYPEADNTERKQRFNFGVTIPNSQEQESETYELDTR